jgi:hypothetical protein
MEMAKMINVSGDSPALKWLLAAGQDVVPWLKISPKQVQIDWDIALDHWRRSTGKEKVSPTVAAVLRSLLPEVPLSLIYELNRPSWRRDEKKESPTTQIMGEPFLIPLDVRTAYAALDATMDTLLVFIAEAMAQKNQRDWGRKILENLCPKLQALRNVTKCCYLRKDTLIRYQLGRRLAVARADMNIFLNGSSASNRYAPFTADLQDRAESWRLTRRLIRSQVDCYERLEEMVRVGVFSPSQSLLDAPLGESWQHLGQIERALAHALNSELIAGKMIRSNGFIKFEREFANLNGLGEIVAEKRSAQSPSFFRGPNPNESPFGLALALLDELFPLIQPLREELRHKRYTAVVEHFVTTLETTAAILRRENRRLIQEMQEPAQGEDIDAVVDWLIAESPVLTFLFSGFLSLYSENEKTNQYGIGLSPWLVASVTSKKFLGTLPMTYLGLDTGGEEGEKEGDGDESTNAPERGSPMTGRRVWELVQSSLA